jgi:hypothetical protein
LAASFVDDFNGSTLDPQWESGNWSGSNVPLISSSILTVPTGTWVRSTGTYTYGVVEVVAEFGAGDFQHIGFASDNFSGNRFFFFSTFIGDGNLYARVNNNAGEQSVDLGPIPAGLHRYRIEWSAVNTDTDHVIFYRNGVFQAEFDVVSDGVVGEASDFYFYLSNAGAANLRVDKAQVEPPYVGSGTYTSCALDAGVGNGWQTISWDATLTPTTSLAVEARVSADGATWTGWQSVTSGGLVNSTLQGRYTQYRLFLSTGNNHVTPLFNSVTLTHDTLTSMSIDNVTVAEAAAGPAGTVNAIFTVSLVTPTLQTATVNYTTVISSAVAPNDYSTAAGTLIFGPGATTRTITVTVKGDIIDEIDEKFEVRLSNPVNASISDDLGVGTITDDDPPPTMSINDSSVIEGNSGTVNALFTVSLSVISGKPITVTYDTADDTATAPDDYTAISGGTLTFAPGVATRPITVTVQGDGLIEPNETFRVNLSSPVNAGLGDSQGIGTITNDDAIGVTITQSGNSTNVTEGGATDTYQVKLTSVPTAAVTITITSDSQVSVAPPSLSFNAINWNTPQTATVTAVNDTVIEPSPHSGVITHTVASSDTTYNGFSISPITVNITDNDAYKIFLPVIMK